MRSNDWMIFLQEICSFIKEKLSSEYQVIKHFLQIGMFFQNPDLLSKNMLGLWTHIVQWLRDQMSSCKNTLLPQSKVYCDLVYGFPRTVPNHFGWLGPEVNHYLWCRMSFQLISCLWCTFPHMITLPAMETRTQYTTMMMVWAGLSSTLVANGINQITE